MSIAVRGALAPLDHFWIHARVTVGQLSPDRDQDLAGQMPCFQLLQALLMSFLERKIARREIGIDSVR